MKLLTRADADVGAAIIETTTEDEKRRLVGGGWVGVLG